jgi:cytochrome c-type protein NapB
MRCRIQPRSQWLLGLVVPLLLLGAGAGDIAKETDDGIDVYFRDTDLGALAKQDVTKYPDTDAGDAELVKRSFPDAPPVVPHTVEDTFVITADDNECLECHHPDNAEEGIDIPMTKTHFRQPVMAKGGEDSPMTWVVEGYRQVEDLAGTRYNCSMCHAPQAENVRTIESTFKRVAGKPTQ